MKNSAKKVSLKESSIVLAVAPNTLRTRLLSGSLLLLTASGVVGAANLLYNVVVAHLLGPTAFGHATAVYTLLTLMSAITLSFQVVCAKFVASHQLMSEKAAVYTSLHRKAWRLGLVISLLLVLARNEVSAYLNLPDPRLILILALGTAFYVPLGVRRGGLQGLYEFRGFGINLVLEGLVRLGGAWLLIQAGMGVTGAVFAGVSGVIAAYLFAPANATLKAKSSDLVIPVAFREALQAIVFFCGQVIINNFDIILAKHFFPSEEAGLYAAVALVGRVVNMCAWSVVSTMFPVSAATREQDREGRSLLVTSLLLVLLIITVILFALWLVPSFLWNIAFGAQFELTTYGTIPGLPILYALTTGIYSLSAVIIAYEMSRKIANTSWVQLAFGGALIMGIYLFHDTLQQVILVQLALMSLLLMVVLFPVLRSGRSAPRDLVPAPTYGNIRRLKPVSEEEVIAEFLKNEFHHDEFDDYREKFEHLIKNPDLTNADENALRRALLFVRRGPMWRELPLDIEWFEVEVTTSDLAGIRVFPRAQWRRVSQGSFFLSDIVRQIEAESAERTEDEFFAKLQRLSKEEPVNRTVLLIGVSDTDPLTILDGNHRVTGAMLAAPSTVLQRFRFLCGFSPRMTECCWYHTNITTLWRYAKNLVRYMPYDPDSDIVRLSQSEL